MDKAEENQAMSEIRCSCSQQAGGRAMRKQLQFHLKFRNIA
jgi:hypothetical protein